jgi:hypothetical protein
LEITQGVARSTAAHRKNTATTVDTEVEAEEGEEEEEELAGLNTNICTLWSRQPGDGYICPKVRAIIIHQVDDDDAKLSSI